MAGKHWVKDVCPYARDQGFLSVVGDVIPGETVFGFTYTSTGTDALVFLTETSSGTAPKVTQMVNTKYRVIATRVKGVSTASAAPIVSAKTKTGFTIAGVTGQDYDVVVIGQVLY